MSHLFNTKADFWEALHRDGIYVPTLESSICTVKWLDKVYHGEQWCPKYSQLTLRPCTRKPVKMCFLQEISKILKERNLKPIIYDQQHTPDVFWCWITLSTLDPDHLFFQKHYVPSEEEKGRKSKQDSKTVISKKEMEFLKDLPANILKNKNIDSHFQDENDFDFPQSSGVKSQRQPNLKSNLQRQDYFQNENINSNNILNQTFQNMSKNHQLNHQIHSSNVNPQFNFINPQSNRSLSNQKVQRKSDSSMICSQQQHEDKHIQVVLSKKMNQK